MFPVLLPHLHLQHPEYSGSRLSCYHADRTMIEPLHCRHSGTTHADRTSIEPSWHVHCRLVIMKGTINSPHTAGTLQVKLSWHTGRGQPNFCFSKSQECHWQDWYILPWYFNSYFVNFSALHANFFSHTTLPVGPQSILSYGCNKHSQGWRGYMHRSHFCSSWLTFLTSV